MSAAKAKSLADPVRELNFLSFEEFQRVPAWAKEHITGMDAEKVRYAFLDGTLSVNLNDEVRFRLTEAGLTQLAADKYETLRRLPDGSFECQLWRFMRVFGRHLHLTCQAPVEKNAIVLQPDRSLLALRKRAKVKGRTRLVARKMSTADTLRAMLAPKQPVFAVSSLAWHRVPGVLPDACTTVLVSLTKEESEPIWLGYYEDEIWRSIDGAPFAGQVYAWADIPEAPPAPLGEKGGRS